MLKDRLAFHDLYSSNTLAGVICDSLHLNFLWLLSNRKRYAFSFQPKTTNVLGAVNKPLSSAGKQSQTKSSRMETVSNASSSSNPSSPGRIKGGKYTRNTMLYIKGLHQGYEILNNIFYLQCQWMKISAYLYIPILTLIAIYRVNVFAYSRWVLHILSYFSFLGQSVVRRKLVSKLSVSECKLLSYSSSIQWDT